LSVFKESETYRPFKYPWAVEAAKEHAIDMHWDVHEVDLLDDIRQFKSDGGLETENVSHKQNKELIASQICLFTEIDKNVGVGYKKLIPYVKNNEISNLLSTFLAREVVHQRAYALAAETFGFPDSAWVEFKDYVEMQDKLDLIDKDIGDLSQPINAAKHLCKVLLGEGIGLFGAFSSFLNFKTKGLLIGFNDINQWSLNDENFHVKYNIKIVKEMLKDCTEDEVSEFKDFAIEMAFEYEACELAYVDLLPDQDGLTKEGYARYFKHLKETRLKELGVLNRLKLSSPSTIPEEFEFMEWLTTGGHHDNFFEKKITDYSHEPLKGNVDYNKYKGILEEKLYG
jgi:ribonucleotide reductase beta subunit family protein with ferritin-like domain